MTNVDIGYSKLEHEDAATSLSGLLPGITATRMAYQWDLTGPTMLDNIAATDRILFSRIPKFKNR